MVDDGRCLVEGRVRLGIVSHGEEPALLLETVERDAYILQGDGDVVEVQRPADVVVVGVVYDGLAVLVYVFIVPGAAVALKARSAPGIVLRVVFQPYYGAVDHRVLVPSSVVDDDRTVIAERLVSALRAVYVALDLRFGWVLHYDDVACVDAADLGLMGIVLHALGHDDAERG